MRERPSRSCAREPPLSTRPPLVPPGRWLVDRGLAGTVRGAGERCDASNVPGGGRVGCPPRGAFRTSPGFPGSTAERDTAAADRRRSPSPLPQKPYLPARVGVSDRRRCRHHSSVQRNTHPPKSRSLPTAAGGRKQYPRPARRPSMTNDPPERQPRRRNRIHPRGR